MGMSETPPSAASRPSVLKRLSDPGILFFLLPWLMILLTAGTIAQKDLGIFEAQKIFFSSWILWLGPLPLPGAYLTLGLLTLCLAIKFIFYSPWRKDRIGTIITHLGILLLLGGGMLTALTQTEGYLSLREGQTGTVISDYHNRVLRIHKDDAVIGTIPFEDLSKGQRILSVDLPFSVTPVATCINCRPAPVKDATDRRGLAQQMVLMSSERHKENETNLSGVTLQVSGADDAQDGLYVTMEEIPHSASVSMDGSVYSFSMGREERALPFTIELIDFRQNFHPGTVMASGFESDVVVHDNGIDWPARIRMNEPLRYKGYTFYQASFAEKPDGSYSVLSVVRNQGRAFPYIASALIFAGLLIHIALRLSVRRKAGG